MRDERACPVRCPRRLPRTITGHGGKTWASLHDARIGPGSAGALERPGGMSCAPAFGESGYSELESGGGGHHRRPPGVDGGDDLFGVDALQVDPAPRGAMRREMTEDTSHPCRLECRPRADAAARRSWGPPRARDRAPWGEASRRCDGRAVLPDARARASETERQSESELVVEAPRFQKRPETWRTWVVHSNDAALIYGGSLHAWLIVPGVVAGGRLRVLAGGAVGVQPAADPVKRIMVNVGSVPCAPGRWWRPGKARCRLMGAGRGGVRVVVRAGESPAHGEGGQQGRGMRRRSGGRA